MFNIPIHPMAVHFPIVLAFILPLFIAWGIYSWYKNQKSRNYWIAAVIVSFFLFLTSFAAVRTGENEEERVERALISETPLKNHEEYAEFFLKITAVAVVVTALGLASGYIGFSFKLLSGVIALFVLFLSFQTGHSGGLLVYQHGAANAYSGNIDSKYQSGIHSEKITPNPNLKKEEDDD